MRLADTEQIAVAHAAVRPDASRGPRTLYGKSASRLRELADVARRRSADRLRMRATELELFAARIERDRRKARDAAVLALLSASAVTPAALVSAGLALALVAGAAAEVVLASVWRSRSLMLVRELALRRSAYGIPEVRAFGSRVASPSRRARLATRLDDVRAAAPRGPLVARLVAFGKELDALAEALRSPQLELEPSCAVACLQLLTDMRRSPLLNASLPADDLSVALHHIRSGFTSATAAALAGKPAGEAVE